MANDPLSKALRREVLEAQLANAKAHRLAVENRIVQKRELNQDTAVDQAELTHLIDSISKIEAELAQP